MLSGDKRHHKWLQLENLDLQLNYEMVDLQLKKGSKFCYTVLAKIPICMKLLTYLG